MVDHFVVLLAKCWDDTPGCHKRRKNSRASVNLNSRIVADYNMKHK